MVVKNGDLPRSNPLKSHLQKQNPRDTYQHLPTGANETLRDGESEKSVTEPYKAPKLEGPGRYTPWN